MRYLAALCLALVLPVRAQAQQAVDLHLGYSRTSTPERVEAFGIGLGLETLLDLLPLVDVAATVSADYERQKNLGPGRSKIGLDATIQPQRETTSFVPYVGGGISANWSGGQKREWQGPRVGLEAVAGLKFSLFTSEVLATRIEQRFGYVRGADHASTTRVGFIFAI